MKIYCVKHSWDNGASYEDYRAYTEHKMFSTYEKALCYYVDSIIENYEGAFDLLSWELDTQEVDILEESPWEDCSLDWAYSDDEDYYSEEPEYDDYQLMPETSIQDYWKWCDEWHGEIIPENPQCDDIAKEFCKEWNENLDNEEHLKTLVHTYDMIFKSIGYLCAWYNYKKAIGIPDFDLIELNSLLNQLV